MSKKDEMARLLVPRYIQQGPSFSSAKTAFIKKIVSADGRFFFAL
jgi:hypothetical protein